MVIVYNETSWYKNNLSGQVEYILLNKPLIIWMNFKEK